MRRHLLFAYVLAFVFCATALMPYALALDAEKPNVVYIMSDELAYFELGYTGSTLIQTPNIDRLAAEGIEFTQALAGCSVCAPLRGTLMTGKHMGHSSVRKNDGGTPLRAEEQTIGSILRAEGYATGGFGKWGCGGRDSTGVPEDHGFDTFVGYYDQVHAHSFYPPYILENSEELVLPGNSGGRSGETYSHYVIMDRAYEFIRENADQPFFCYLPITPPHGMYDIPEEDPAVALYTDEDWSQDVKNYAAMVSMVDRQVGEVVDLLEELDIADNTIVFFGGDNGGYDRFRSDEHPDGFFGPNLNPATGIKFRGGKGNLYEGGLRIPMLAYWPGQIESGRKSDLVWYHPDVMPTIAELCGATSPDDTDGISFLPEILGKEAVGRSQESHEFLYWEYGGQRAVRMGAWKAILPRQNGEWELYDLDVDLSETNDLAGQELEILATMIAHAEASSEPCVEGTFTTRVRHERDRWAKYGDTQGAPTPREAQNLPTEGLIPRDGWKIVSASSDTDGRLAAYAIDGVPTTHWHTEFSPTLYEHPHELIIDMGTAHEITAFRLLARQDGGFNGAIADCAIYVSDDPETWGDPCVETTLKKTHDPQEVACKTAVRGRYIRLVALSEVNEGPWASLSEIGAVGEAIANPNEEGGRNDDLLTCIPVSFQDTEPEIEVWVPFDFTELTGPLTPELLRPKEVTKGQASLFDFGSLVLGESVPMKAFEIKNTGSAPLLLDPDACSLPTGFSWAVRPMPSPIRPGSKAILAINFTPSVRGPHEGVVSLATNDADENPFTFTIKGTAELPDGEDRATVQDFRLLSNTRDDSDGATYSTTVTGNVFGHFDGGTATVEFDWDGNEETIEGSTTVESVGEMFIYDPCEDNDELAVTYGPMTIRYRVVENLSDGSTFQGEWESLSFTLKATPPFEGLIPEIGLAHDTGRSNEDGVTFDPRLKGQAGSGEPQYLIQFEIDGSIVGSAMTNDEGVGFFRPTSLAARKSYEIRGRVKVWNPRMWAYQFGVWSEPFLLTYDLDGPSAVTELRRADLDEDSPYRKLTLVGSIDSATEIAGAVMIQFDFDGDGEADMFDSDGDNTNDCFYQTYTTGRGQFVFQPDPELLSPDEENKATIQARSVRVLHDPDAEDGVGDLVPGPWKKATIEYESPPGTTVKILAFAKPEEEDETQSYSAEFIGRVIGHDAPFAHVELRRDGTNLPNAFHICNGGGGFNFRISHLGGWDEDEYGVRSISARWVVLDDDKRIIESQEDWTTFTFTLLDRVMPDLSIATLEAEVITNRNDSGGSSQHLLIEGTITEEEEDLYGTLVRYWMDDEVWADLPNRPQTTVDRDGEFSFTIPSVADNQSTTLHVNLAKWNYATSAMVEGEVKSLTLNNRLSDEAESAPILPLESLELQSDTGTSQTDHVTSNPMIIGSIAITEETPLPRGTNVHIDVDGDGQADANSPVQPDGTFSHRPYGLGNQTHTIRAWASYYDREAGGSVTGEPKELTFALHDPLGAEPNIANPLLVNDTGDDDSDSKSYDPTITGSVVVEWSRSNVRIELDVNGDGNPDQSTTADENGRFTIRPNGLKEGVNTVRLRAMQNSTTSGGIGMGDWYDMTLEYVVPPPLTAEIQSLELMYDDDETGTSPTTSRPFFQGSISRGDEFLNKHFGLSGLYLELDYDEDGETDDFTQTDYQGGFRKYATGLTEGSVTIAARLIQYDQAQAVRGEWKPLTFTYDPPEGPPPKEGVSFASLTLKNDTGTHTSDGATSDPTIQGTLTGEGYDQNVKIVLDIDGDYKVDETLTADETGAFHFAIPTNSIDEGYLRISAAIIRNHEEEYKLGEKVQFRYTFIYDDEPDSLEAQQLVRELAEANQAWSDAQRTHAEESARIQEEYERRVREAIIGSD
jgi:arylsulfatase A-like enzyme